MDSQADWQPSDRSGVPALRDFEAGGAPGESVSDFAIAQAAAETARAVPGVVGLSSGVPPVIATYGVGARVAGVLVRHPAPNRLSLEIHVILNQAQCETIASVMAHSPAHADGTSEGTLILLASLIRGAVLAAVKRTRASRHVQADVLIDDVR